MHHTGYGCLASSTGGVVTGQFCSVTSRLTMPEHFWNDSNIARFDMDILTVMVCKFGRQASQAIYTSKGNSSQRWLQSSGEPSLASVEKMVC